jgi:hypothetical protein
MLVQYSVVFGMVHYRANYSSTLIIQVPVLVVEFVLFPILVQHQYKYISSSISKAWGLVGYFNYTRLWC